MKKGVSLFVSIFTTILLIVLMFGLVSANPFSDFFKNIFSGPQFSPAENNLVAYYNFDSDASCDSQTNYGALHLRNDINLSKWKKRNINNQPEVHCTLYTIQVQFGKIFDN